MPFTNPLPASPPVAPAPPAGSRWSVRLDLRLAGLLALLALLAILGWQALRRSAVSLPVFGRGEV